MVTVQMTNEYPHLPINARSRLKELPLSSLAAIEEKKFRSPPHENAWKVSKFARNASARPKKGH
jgi:hypothetical protein